jgi:pimeloyl-ACP methyl ester carboxylesterase
MKLLLSFSFIASMFLAQVVSAASLAVASKTQFVEVNNRKIAYRSIGKGQPMILALRFRGIMDSWDPAFLDALAKDFRVITFDYSGIGRSTGPRATKMTEMADDIKDLATGLKLKKIIVAGWSLGGAVAQETLARHPDLVSHGILMGASPIGNKTPPDKEFLAASAKPINDLPDEEILFFYPASEISRQAAKASHERIASRTKDLSVMVPPEFFGDQFKAVADFKEDKRGVSKMLTEGKTPILVLAGDHDIACHVEDWYALSGKMASVQMIVLPQAGHGPQHQYPELSAKYIREFVKIQPEDQKN